MELNLNGKSCSSTSAGHGLDFVRHLDGEFAVALFDFQQRQLVLARDPFGTKPLWYAIGGTESTTSAGAFAFSSYASALRRLGFQDEESRSCGQVEAGLEGKFKIFQGVDQMLGN